jgi:exodeoxyribonuclease V alpha subunit
VNQGIFPILQTPNEVAEPDFFFIEREEPAEIIEAIKTLVAERIPRKFLLDPIADVQVLSPMRRGPLGVDAINRELQALLNPREGEREELLNDDAEEAEGPIRLRVGDRVMQTANDYEKEIANGDVGRVARVDPATGEVIVQFDGRRVSYLADEARRLVLAYAVTIHKAQGSEYPAVVIPLHLQHWVMLQRNLLYTAITRARRLVCLVGSKRALGRAVRNTTRQSRNSALRFYLQKK